MRPEPNPISSDARRVRRARRLPPDAACALCGEQQPRGPGLRKVPRWLLEGHHAAVESNDEFLIVVLCLNCHARATALQHDVGVLVPDQADTFLEGMDRALRFARVVLRTPGRDLLRVGGQVGPGCWAARRALSRLADDSGNAMSSDTLAIAHRVWTEIGRRTETSPPSSPGEETGRPEVCAGLRLRDHDRPTPVPHLRVLAVLPGRLEWLSMYRRRDPVCRRPARKRSSRLRDPAAIRAADHPPRPSGHVPSAS